MVFPGFNAQGLDLLKKLLRFDPNERITVNDALRHPFFEGFSDPDDEPTGELITRFDFEFEFFDLKTTEYRELIY